MNAAPLLVLQQMDGGLIVAVLCALLFLEECGVPLPMLPGDLLLLVAGIALAMGRVDPFVLIPAIALALIAGGMIGREIFSLIGRKPLWALADRLHMRRLLDCAAARVSGSGWRGIFVARLIPGLRVHTNQVAGALAIPRGRFATGLIPSALVYLGVFVGAGALFGTEAVSAVRAADAWLIRMVAVAAVAGLMFLAVSRLRSS